jgi:16S rRNA (guanine966-N2)-methyltransferase
VDSDADALATCRANLDHTKLAARGRVVGADAGRFVAADLPVEAPFSLVLCDPPYELDDDAVAAVLRELAAPGWLEQDARVVVERPRRRRSGIDEPVVSWPPGYAGVWERTYGDTLVTALEPRSPATGP